MELKIITNTVDLKSIEAGWCNLLRDSDNGRIHQSYDWFWAGYQTFHQNDQLYVLTLIDVKGNLCGVAPLVITSGVYRGIKVKKIGFVINDQNPACEFILSEGLEEACLKIFLEHLASFKEWEFVDLRKVDIERPTGILLQKLLTESGQAFGTKDNIESPYFTIDTGWEEFWKNRSQKFRKAMRNKLNRAKKHEGLVVEKIPVRSGNAPELADMLRISTNSWKKTIGNDLSTKKYNWEFYKKICDLFGPEGVVCIWFLKLNGVAVAFEFHLQYNKIVYPIRADFDEGYKDISPGSILEYEIIQSLFSDRDVLEYNSCGHTYDYLMNWTDKTRKHQNFEIFDKSFKMAMLYNFEYNILVMLRGTKLYSFITKMKARHQ
jgi:CelD/BcsL family acetyltransferase involved in cellulose biosynthesis